jgi:rsbT co-antagonist protein RsbR
MNDRDSVSPPGRDIQSELLDSIGVVLATLKSVSKGDLSHRLEVKYPESHPVGALAISVNSMIDALTEARTQSDNYLGELADRIELIERQREAIRTLSVPIIQVWTGVLCVPIVGALDTMRAAEVTNTLLTSVVARKARQVIIDVTGIEVMDTSSADYFLRMARAVTLLGAECALSGVHPNIAHTVIHMGVDLSGLKSYRSLRDALREFVVKQGIAKGRPGRGRGAKRGQPAR